MKKYHIAPILGKTTIEKPWWGDCKISPMDYEVTVALPVLGQVECTKICIELLRLQTVKPFFVIVDTGSSPADLKRFLRLRAEDVEVHSLRLNGTFHPSEFVANALDLCWSLARTEYIYTTHSDVFARRRDLLEWGTVHVGQQREWDSLKNRDCEKKIRLQDISVTR